ncbi:MAG TPA: thiolase family protein [Limnochordales bacterium]
MRPEAVIVDALRTPVGRYAGALSDVRPDDLAALVLRAVLERNGIEPGWVDDVYFGCANQAGEDNRNVARMAVLLAGLPETVPGVTVNRLCASGLEAVIQAVRAIWAGEAEIVVAGGVESMSRAPLVLPKPETAFPRGAQTLHDTTLGWRLVNPRMAERYPPLSLGETAENLAERYGISRQEQDLFALASHRKAHQAWEAGRFAREVIPVEKPSRKGAAVRVERDEGIRPDTSLDKLASLPPAFRDGGTVTAGNSSPLSDGAAAVLLMAEHRARALGLRPLARAVASGVAGVHPNYMGIGPVPATRQALQRAGLSLEQMDVIEINEAFAAQVLACLREWRVEPDDARLNPNGGAIAIGHPLGCSGARLVGTLVHELHRREGRFGLATLCVGVGQGLSLVVERLDR